MFSEISQNSQENTCGKVSFLITLQAEATASDLYQNEVEKGKYPDGVQIFTFWLSIDLFDVKDLKRNLADVNFDQKMCLKGI